MTQGTTRGSRDILSRPWLAFLVFWLPAIAMAATGNLHLSSAGRAILWSVALTIMGTGCLVNAMRCRRMHCYMTGPFFLAMAVLTLLYGFGLLPLGSNGWNALSLTILIGAIALYFVPELLFGKYRRQPGSEKQ